MWSPASAESYPWLNVVAPDRRGGGSVSIATPASTRRLPTRVPIRFDAALDPGNEVVECPLAHVAVDGAVAGPADRALYEQVRRAGGQRPPAVGLLQAEGGSRVTSLVEGKDG